MYRHKSGLSLSLPHSLEVGGPWCTSKRLSAEICVLGGSSRRLSNPKERDSNIWGLVRDLRGGQRTPAPFPFRQKPRGPGHRWRTDDGTTLVCSQVLYFCSVFNL